MVRNRAFNLKIYLPTLKQDNKWLWRGKRRNSHLDAESVNDLLKKLAKDAGLQLAGSLHYHAFRKLFMRAGVELGCNHWAIKMLVGKAVNSSDLIYISQAQLRETFSKICKVLRINEPQSNTKIPSLEEAVELVMKVQKEELLEKVKKLWNEKYGKYAVAGTGERMGLMVRQPDFDRMTPKELLREYLELLKERK